LKDFWKDTDCRFEDRLAQAVGLKSKKRIEEELSATEERPKKRNWLGSTTFRFRRKRIFRSVGISPPTKRCWQSVSALKPANDHSTRCAGALSLTGPRTRRSATGRLLLEWKPWTPLRMKDDAPFVFAGLWESWRDPAADEWLRKKRTGCGTAKPLTEYSRSRRFSDGLNRDASGAAESHVGALTSRTAPGCWPISVTITLLTKLRQPRPRKPTERSIGRGSPNIFALIVAVTKPNCWSTAANIVSPGSLGDCSFPEHAARLDL
jgi:hypothetical protein